MLTKVGPATIPALETADEEEEERHEEGAGDEHGAASPAVDVYDGGDRENDVEDILHRVGDEVRAATGETSALEDVDDVVPAARR